METENELDDSTVGKAPKKIYLMKVNSRCERNLSQDFIFQFCSLISIWEIFHAIKVSLNVCLSLCLFNVPFSPNLVSQILH